eukprot:399039_1
MRKFYDLNELTPADATYAYQVAGGIPLWLIQSAVKRPDEWLQRRIQTVKNVVDEQSDADTYYKVQSHMIRINKDSLKFSEFIKLAGSVDNAISLLHGIQRQQKHNRLFFHDLNKNKVSLSYQFLKQIPLKNQDISIEKHDDN